MNIYGWLQIIIYLVVILALAKPLGSYMARVFEGRRLSFILSLVRWSGSFIAWQE